MTSSGIQTASNAKLARELKAVQEENVKLRRELNETRSDYNQLVNEASHEKFDERRVHFLKSQIAQLERQVIILSEALSSKAATTVEIDDTLSTVIENLRTWIGLPQRGTDVSISRPVLMKMLDSVLSSQRRLYKNTEEIGPENVNQLPRFTGQFAKTNYPITMMDVCSGRLNHLNLKHVAKLESKLSVLYKNLLHLLQTLTTVMSHDETCPTSGHIIKAANERLAGHLAKSCDMLLETTQQLMALSVLVPAAPWPPLAKNFLKDLTTEDVMSALPKFPRSRQKEGREMVEALMKALNYTKHMSSMEAKVCREELKFHQSVYQLQVSYAESLFEAVRESYMRFEESTQHMVCHPVSTILDKFDKLRETASEQELREFLACFKDKSDELREVVGTLSRDGSPTNEGSEAMSQFGEQFFKSLKAVKADCRRKRDDAASELETVRADSEEHSKNSLLVFQKEVLITNDSDVNEQHRELESQRRSGDSSTVSNESRTSTKDNKELPQHGLKSDYTVLNEKLHDVSLKDDHFLQNEATAVVGVLPEKIVKKPPTPKSRVESAKRTVRVESVQRIQTPVRSPSRSSSADSLSNIPSPSGRNPTSTQRPRSGSLTRLKLKPGGPPKKPWVAQ